MLDKPSDDRDGHCVAHRPVAVVICSRQGVAVGCPHQSGAFPNRQQSGSDLAILDRDDYLPAAASFGRPQTPRHAVEPDLQPLNATASLVGARSLVSGADEPAACAERGVKLRAIPIRQHPDQASGLFFGIPRCVALVETRQRGFAHRYRWKRPPYPFAIGHRTSGSEQACWMKRCTWSGQTESLDVGFVRHRNQEGSGTALRKELLGIDHETAGPVTQISNRPVGRSKVGAIIGNQETDDVFGNEDSRLLVRFAKLVEDAEPMPKYAGPRFSSDTRHVAGEREILTRKRSPRQVRAWNRASRNLRDVRFDETVVVVICSIYRSLLGTVVIGPDHFEFRRHRVRNQSAAGKEIKRRRPSLVWPLFS